MFLPGVPAGAIKSFSCDKMKSTIAKIRANKALPTVNILRSRSLFLRTSTRILLCDTSKTPDEANFLTKLLKMLLQDCSKYSTKASKKQASKENSCKYS
jgi:hypothetical protein